MSLLSRIKYPIFFLGSILMTVPPIAYKYYAFSAGIVTDSVVIGFLLFALSIVLGISAFTHEKG